MGSGIVLKTASEIAHMRAAGRVVHSVLQQMRDAIAPGTTTTNDLERIAVSVIAAAGGASPFLGYAPTGHPPYPAWTCISVNEQVVHGIPGRRVLQQGDIVGCDVGVSLNGFFADSAWSFPVGRVKPAAQRLLTVGEEALYTGISAARSGAYIGDIGSAIEKFVRKNGFTVVKEMVGHGIGRRLHEPPQVPNFGRPKTGPLIEPGMTICIEPMVNAGGSAIEVLDDEWTIVTADHSLSVHFEHTVAITPTGAQILTQGD